MKFLSIIFIHCLANRCGEYPNLSVRSFTLDVAVNSQNWYIRKCVATRGQILGVDELLITSCTVLFTFWFAYPVLLQLIIGCAERILMIKWSESLCIFSVRLSEAKFATRWKNSVLSRNISSPCAKSSFYQDPLHDVVCLVKKKKKTFLLEMNSTLWPLYHGIFMSHTVEWT